MSVISLSSSDDPDDCCISVSSEEDADLEQTHEVFINTDPWTDEKLSQTDFISECQVEKEDEETQDPLSEHTVVVNEESQSRNPGEIRDVINVNNTTLSSDNFEETYSTNEYFSPEQYNFKNNEDQVAPSLTENINEIKNTSNSHLEKALPTKIQFLAERLVEALKHVKVSTETIVNSPSTLENPCYKELKDYRSPENELSNLEKVILQVSKTDFSISNYTTTKTKGVFLKDKMKMLAKKCKINKTSNRKELAISKTPSLKQNEAISISGLISNNEVINELNHDAHTQKKETRGRKKGWKKNPNPADCGVDLQDLRKIKANKPKQPNNDDLNVKKLSKTLENKPEKKKPGRKKGWRKYPVVSDCNLDVLEKAKTQSKQNNQYSQGHLYNQNLKGTCVTSSKYLSGLENNNQIHENYIRPTLDQGLKKALTSNEISNVEKLINSGKLSIIYPKQLFDNSSPTTSDESLNKTASNILLSKLTINSNPNKSGPCNENEEVQLSKSFLEKEVNCEDTLDPTITKQPSNSEFTPQELSRLRKNFIKCYNIIFDESGENDSMKMGDLLHLTLKESQNLKSRLEKAEKFTCENLKKEEIDLAMLSYKNKTDEYKKSFQTVFFDMYRKIKTDKTISNLYKDQYKCLIISVFLKSFMRATNLDPDFSDCLIEAKDIVVNIFFSRIDFSKFHALSLVHDIFFSSDRIFEQNCWVVLDFLQDCFTTSEDQGMELNNTDNSETTKIHSKDNTNDQNPPEGLAERLESTVNCNDNHTNSITLIQNNNPNDNKGVPLCDVSLTSNHNGNHEKSGAIVDDPCSPPNNVQEPQSNSKCIFYPVIQSTCNNVLSHKKNTTCSTLAANVSEVQTRSAQVQPMQPDVPSVPLKRKVSGCQETSCSKYQNVGAQHVKTSSLNSSERNAYLQSNNYYSFHQNSQGQCENKINANVFNRDNMMYNSVDMERNSIRNAGRGDYNCVGRRYQGDLRDINMPARHQIASTTAINTPQNQSNYYSQSLHQQDMPYRTTSYIQSPCVEKVHQPPLNGSRMNIAYNNFSSALNNLANQRSHPYTVANQPIHASRTDRAAEEFVRHHNLQYRQNAQRFNKPPHCQGQYFNNANCELNYTRGSGLQQYYPPRNISGPVNSILERRLSIQVPNKRSHNSDLSNGVTVNNYNINNYMVPPPTYQDSLKQKQSLELQQVQGRDKAAQMVQELQPKEVLHYRPKD